MNNYPAVIRELRKIAINLIKLDKESEDFKITMMTTDAFHPFDSEGEYMIGRALKDVYDEYDKDYLEEAILEFLSDTLNMVKEYYDNRYNFPPGYVLPKITIAYNCDDIAVKEVDNIIAAYRS